MKGETAGRSLSFFPDDGREKRPFPGGEIVIHWGQKSLKELTL